MWLALVLAAAVVGALSGGGAMVALPVLVASGAPQGEAVVRSLVVVGAASAISAAVHARAGRVDLGVAARFGVAGALSALVVGRISDGWPVALGATVFGALGVIAALDLLLGRDRAPAPASAWQDLVTALGVGALSGWVGAGGGFLLVPLIARRTSFERALGTASAVLAAQALAGIVGHAGAALPAAPLALDAAAGLVGGALGLVLASRLRVARLRGAVALTTAVLASYVALRQGALLVALAVGVVPTLVRLARRRSPTLVPVSDTPRLEE